MILFGPPGAGKTALAEALAHEKGDKAAKVEVIDSSGESALKMLEAEKPFADSHPMKAPILTSDGVMVVIDVSASKKQINDDFKHAARWLKALHEYRGQHTEIADLPVYVVLTKCDQLVHKDDTLETWKKRLEEHKQKYLEQFEKQLEEQGDGFGSIALKVLTTSTKPPVFGDKPLKSKDPLGVNELFVDSARAAADYQERRRSAHSRLQNVLVGLIGLIVMLGLFVLFLMEFQPPPRATVLEEQVQLVLPKPEATPAQRLAGTPPRLEQKLKILNEIENHKDFERLAGSDRIAVTNYRQELTDYLRRFYEAQPVLKLPHLAKNQQELDKQEKDLNAYQLTEKQASEWAETRLGRQLAQVRKEYASLHQAIKEEVAWIRSEISRTSTLLREGSSIYGKLLNNEKTARDEAVDWMRRFNELQPKPHQPREENISDVTRVIWEDLGKFDEVKAAHRDWNTAKGELTGIAKLIEKKLKST
jgi:GTPase SAR1 family protein